MRNRIEVWEEVGDCVAELLAAMIFFEYLCSSYCQVSFQVDASQWSLRVVIFFVAVRLIIVAVWRMFPGANPSFSSPSAQQNANNMNLAAALYLHPSLGLQNQAYSQFYQQVVHSYILFSWYFWNRILLVELFWCCWNMTVDIAYPLSPGSRN